MANVSPTPFSLDDVVLTVGGNTYQDGLSEVTFTPTRQVTTVQGMSPNAIFPIAGKTTWTCTISGFQDPDNAQSLSNYLSSTSTAVSAVFKPRAAGSSSYGATILPVPVTIGGQQGNVATFQVQMNVQGQVQKY